MGMKMKLSIHKIPVMERAKLVSHCLHEIIYMDDLLHPMAEFYTQDSDLCGITKVILNAANKFVGLKALKCRVNP